MAVIWSPDCRSEGIGSGSGRVLTLVGLMRGINNRGWVREADVSPPARSAEAFKNIDLAMQRSTLIHKLYMQHKYKNKTQ